MSDAMRLQQNVLNNLQKILPELLPDHLLTTAMMITGIVRGRHVQLRKIAEKVAYAHKQTSLIDRFRRFVNNRHIESQVQYNPFVVRILQSLSPKQLYLLIDSSKIGNNSLTLMVSVYYQHRALPLAWVTYKGRKGHSSQAVQLALFRSIQKYLNPECRIIVLGDGEFDGSEVIDYFRQAAKWEYTCRADESTLVYYQGRWCALKELPVTPGQDGFFSELLFTQSQQVGPLNIFAAWVEAEQRHWFFVTSALELKTAKQWYKKRFTTETLFSDVKKRGFQIAETRLQKPERVDRLLFVAAVAYVFTIWLGIDALRTETYRQLIRTDDLYYSLFQLGLIYLDHLLNHDKSLPIFDNFALPEILPIFGGP